MILDGKKYRDKLLEEYKKQIEQHNLKIGLAIIHIGNDSASNIYIKSKEKFCRYVGINVKSFCLDDDVTLIAVTKLIESLNEDEEVTGIIIQSPIPKHLNIEYLNNLIKPSKDVDGNTLENIYKLYLNKPTILPCTVKGIWKLLNYYNIDVTSKNVVIVGRGNLVGKPLALLFNNLNATVSLCHSCTKNLEDYTKRADIIIMAVGKPNLLKANMIKKDAILIDVGVSQQKGKIVGDIDFDDCVLNCQYITPNPGGVGPMTVAMLIDNLLEMKGIKENVEVG